MVRLHCNPSADPVYLSVHLVFADIEDIETYMPGFIEVRLLLYKYTYVNRAHTEYVNMK